jgi:hypothetical protein
VSGRLRSWLTAFDGKPLRRGIAAAVVVALMATGTGVAYAAWTASVTATSTASAATLTVTTSNVNSLAATFGNEAIASAGSVSLTSTGSVTVANTTTTTSTTVPALTLTLSSASGARASAVNATVWYQATGTCTAATAVGAGSVTGAWSGPVVLTSTLAKGASATYCVRSTIANRQDAAIAAGTQSFVPQVSAQLTVGNFTGTASAQSSTAQATRSLFPLATPTATSWYMVKRAGSSGNGLCMDVNGGGGTSGTTVITYTCKTSDFGNQEWQFTQDATSGYFDIKPRSAATLRVDAQTGSVAVVTDGSAVTQLWQPQLVSAGVYQFVNKSTGLCLVSSATSGTTAMTVATCDGSAGQKFTLTETATGATGSLQGLACQDYAEATNVSLTWTGNGLGPYRTQVQRNGTWYLVNTGTSAWQSNAEIQGSSVPTGSNPGPLTGWPDGSYPMRIIDSSNNVVGSGLSVEVYSVTQWWVFTTTYLRCG